MSDDVINEVAVAEDPRLGYPSHHDWSWMDLDQNYGGWIDAAYPMINRLTRERDEARAEVERLRDALNVICAEPWLRDPRMSACAIANDALAAQNYNTYSVESWTPDN